MRIRTFLYHTLGSRPDLPLDFRPLLAENAPVQPDLHCRIAVKSLADALPPEIASQIHPDWRKNEADYWTVRDALLQQYRDQWVAFADGSVIAFGRNPTNVFHDGMATGRHPYFTRVGHENEPERVRRTTYAYDTSYPGEAMP